jgi:hypothetical protein
MAIVVHAAGCGLGEQPCPRCVYCRSQLYVAASLSLSLSLSLLAMIPLPLLLLVCRARPRYTLLGVIITPRGVIITLAATMCLL